MSEALAARGHPHPASADVRTRQRITEGEARPAPGPPRWPVSWITSDPRRRRTGAARRRRLPRARSIARPGAFQHRGNLVTKQQVHATLCEGVCRVHIRAFEAAKRVRVEASDTGPGDRPRTRTSALQTYVRADPRPRTGPRARDLLSALSRCMRAGWAFSRVQVAVRCSGSSCQPAPRSFLRHRPRRMRGGRPSRPAARATDLNKQATALLRSTIAQDSRGRRDQPAPARPVTRGTKRPTSRR